MDTLTDKQLAVLRLVAKGMTNAQITATLQGNAVNFKRLYGSLRCQTRLKAMLRAMDMFDQTEDEIADAWRRIAILPMPLRNLIAAMVQVGLSDANISNFAELWAALQKHALNLSQKHAKEPSESARMQMAALAAVDEERHLRSALGTIAHTIGLRPLIDDVWWQLIHLGYLALMWEQMHPTSDIT